MEERRYCLCNSWALDWRPYEHHKVFAEIKVVLLGPHGSLGSAHLSGPLHLRRLRPGRQVEGHSPRRCRVVFSPGYTLGSDDEQCCLSPCTDLKGQWVQCLQSLFLPSIPSKAPAATQWKLHVPISWPLLECLKAKCLKVK